MTKFELFYILISRRKRKKNGRRAETREGEKNEKHKRNKRTGKKNGLESECEKTQEPHRRHIDTQHRRTVQAGNGRKKGSGKII